MTRSPLLLHPHEGPLHGRFPLPVSKSLANRLLILQALSGVAIGEPEPDLPGDVATLMRLLRHPGPVWDAGAGGTTLRFLTAWLALSDRRGTVTGSERMLARPIAPLVEALRQIGARIGYGGEEGFPPLVLEGFAGQVRDEVALDASMSSQYLSALLLCAPALPRGLTLHLPKGVTSRPYLHMTLRVLSEAGVRWEAQSDRIRILPGPVAQPAIPMESDWTAASYAYALMALAPAESELLLPGLRFSGLQGDQVIAEWMEAFGVVSQVTEGGVVIRRMERQLTGSLDLDFRDHPDLAQTMVVLCALLGIPGRFRGLHTLAIKETDRTAALAVELAVMGADFIPDPGRSDKWVLTGKIMAAPRMIRTREDHRMAMAFSLCAMRVLVRLDDRQVTGKSFPAWWQVLQGLGFRIEDAGLER